MADSINMRTVRRIDASVNSIVCSAKQVQLYEHENGSWVKADYAGGFHICSRAASPYFTMVIVTKTSTKLWVEPLLPDLEFEHQPPFLLYRTKHGQIYGLWFYDRAECSRIMEVLQSIRVEHRQMLHDRQEEQRALVANSRRRQKSMLQLLVEGHNEAIRAQDFDDSAGDADDEDFDPYECDEERLEEPKLFKPKPLRPQAGDPAIVGGELVEVGFRTTREETYSETVGMSQPENILKKLFSNATFESDAPLRVAATEAPVCDFTAIGNTATTSEEDSVGAGSVKSTRGGFEAEFLSKFENEADESVNHSDTPPLLTPAMIALPESWNTSKSSDRERSLPRDIIPNDLNRIETTFDSQPRRGGPITLQEVREALLHVVQHNDMVVREVMEVIWERRGQRRPDGDVNWTANGRWNHIHF